MAEGLAVCCSAQHQPTCKLEDGHHHLHKRLAPPFTSACVSVPPDFCAQGNAPGSSWQAVARTAPLAAEVLPTGAEPILGKSKPQKKESPRPRAAREEGRIKHSLGN